MNNFSIYKEIFNGSNDDYTKMSSEETDKTLSGIKN